MSSCSNFDFLRQQMVDSQLIARDITDPRVLAAMAAVPRHLFVPRHLQSQAYIDAPLPIGFDQTISQPYVVALFCQLLKLKGSEKVLDVGTGSGYQAAVLSHLASQVVSLEKIKNLARQAQKRLQKLGYQNIQVVRQNARAGYPQQAPYQAIVSAAATHLIPPAWIEQLDKAGIIVFPQNSGFIQRLLKLTKENGHFTKQYFGPVAFVPLV